MSLECGGGCSPEAKDVCATVFEQAATRMKDLALVTSEIYGDLPANIQLSAANVGRETTILSIRERLSEAGCERNFHRDFIIAKLTETIGH